MSTLTKKTENRELEELNRELKEVNRELKEFETSFKLIQKMPVSTEIERLFKNYKAEQLHVRILKRLLSACNRSREDIKKKFAKLLKEIQEIHEIIF